MATLKNGDSLHYVYEVKQDGTMIPYLNGVVFYPTDRPRAHFEERTMKRELEARQKALKGVVERAKDNRAVLRALKAPAAVLGLGLILGGCQTTASGSSRWSAGDLIAAVSTTCNFVVAGASAAELIAVLGPKYGSIASLSSAVCRELNRVIAPRATARAGMAAPRMWAVLDGVQIVGHRA